MSSAVERIGNIARVAVFRVLCVRLNTLRSEGNVQGVVTCLDNGAVQIISQTYYNNRDEPLMTEAMRAVQNIWLSATSLPLERQQQLLGPYAQTLKDIVQNYLVTVGHNYGLAAVLVDINRFAPIEHQVELDEDDLELEDEDDGVDEDEEEDDDEERDYPEEEEEEEEEYLHQIQPNVNGLNFRYH
eukprot:TRINITY_DN2234_c0_g1_i1.p1 TRINITY_DN2234_c0_g1~~TRINITY_DN2234_c0_g1_i1.p1  ORF type:complete len:186 (+),score=47.42 TRINITY_DN2234_c0_g1_i1:2-559(+)